jgi:hypothetical protein
LRRGRTVTNPSPATLTNAVAGAPEPTHHVRVVAVINRADGDEYLLVNDTADVWRMLSCDVRPGEIHRDALRRVISEALGSRVVAGNWLGVDHVPGDDKHPVDRLDFIYAAELESPVDITLGDGLAAYRWVHKDDAMTVLAPGHEAKRFLELVFAGASSVRFELVNGEFVPR